MIGTAVFWWGATFGVVVSIVIVWLVDRSHR